MCISSICGLAALGCPIAYAGAKAALQSYVKNQSKYLGQFGVRINSVVPGNILFENSVWERKLTESKLAVQNMPESQVALAKLGRPEDVAALAVFLASERAEFITGSECVVDGGQAAIIEVVKDGEQYNGNGWVCVCLITGAGGLLGIEHARALLHLNATVIVTDVSELGKKTHDILSKEKRWRQHLIFMYYGCEV